LVPLFQSSDLWEITSSGVLVKRIPLEGTPFSTALLPDGNYLVACGDAHSYCVLNLETEAIEQKVTADEVKGVSLSFVAQVLPLENGGLYLCNWQGHESTSSVKDNPRLIELNSAGEIVWRLSDNPAFGSISTVARMP
jgi:WD40 repeat protein